MDFQNNPYKDIFQLSPQPMWIYDIDTLRFLEVNEAAIRHYGYSREDFLSMTIKEIRPEDTIPQFELAMDNVHRHKERFTNKRYKHLKKNGDVIAVEIKSNLFELNGKPAELIIATDITSELQHEQAAKRLEETLLLSEKRFKALIQAGSDLTSIIDMDGKYRFLSESCISLLKIYPDKMIGKTAYDYIHPEDRERVVEQMNSLLEVERVHIQPFRFLNGNNEWRWLTTTARNMLEDPAISGIVTNSTDITELININEELKLSNDRYKLMLKAADEAICDWDIQNDIAYWSVGFNEIFGYNLDVYNNTLWSDNIFPDDREQALKELNDAVKNPETEVLHSEYRFLKANREVAIIHYRGIFLRDKDGNAIRSIGSYRDITAYKENISQVQRQAMQLQEIAWTQSHKIRDSLAKIIGLVDLLKNEDFVTDAQKEILTFLNKSATDLDNGIRNIVNITYTLDKSTD
ncbi:PAS domain S-box-containing protein [Pedobacter cryoconitis]|uniref:histidine kinase n=1 Tax=Pedobacter cryoconitis TaxID=188932 RepID=A0A7W8YW31_9SPHI|nr:PAS domain-containing protein [Pedobacter cryoconitis]MBB5622841.1 PAS domain S-box-containing protein [Pedobacter cryoconitis]